MGHEVHLEVNDETLKPIVEKMIGQTVVSSIVPWVLMNGKRLVYENRLVCSLLGKGVWGGKVITRKSSTQS